MGGTIQANFRKMKDRIIWIDWAKALGIMIVIYCHTPQNDNFVNTFLHAFQMPLFFMLAGYLHKNSQQTILERIKKYWKSLIIPYILLQFISYPYFLIQLYVQEGVALNDFTKYVAMPFAQCLWGIPIDGPTWFIFALLITKLIADISFKSRFSAYIIILLCSLSIIGSWILYKDNQLVISLFTIHSLSNFFPFFFVGYYLKTHKIIKGENWSKSLIKAGIYFTISALLISVNTNSYPFHRISFYILGLSGSFFLINICKTFKNCPDFIQTASIGNIIILGLHWMFIGTTNFVLEKIFSIEGGIHYTEIEAVILVILITIANCIIIKFCQKHFRALLGYR